MKPCVVCQQPKTWHTWSFTNFGDHKHEYKADNLAYLERQLKLKEAREKAHRLNYCQICKLVRKSPFGICRECSERLIAERKCNDSLV